MENNQTLFSEIQKLYKDNRTKCNNEFQKLLGKAKDTYQRAEDYKYQHIDAFDSYYGLIQPVGIAIAKALKAKYFMVPQRANYLIYGFFLTKKSLKELKPDYCIRIKSDNNTLRYFDYGEKERYIKVSDNVYEFVKSIKSANEKKSEIKDNDIMWFQHSLAPIVEI